MSQNFDNPDLDWPIHLADPRPMFPYRDPTVEILGPFRPLLVRLYLEENQPLSRVMGYMRDNYAIKPAPHAYKNRFREWGMSKYNKRDKKRPLLESNINTPHLCHQCSQNIARRIKKPKRVHGECFLRIDATKNSEGKPREPNKLSILFGAARPSIQRALPTREVKYAELSYVMRNFLESSFSSGLCKTGHMGLLQWASSNVRTARVAEEFKMTMWHGIKYHIEERYKAATLCWEHALSQLEQLYHYPDLDIWAGYVKFCAELQRIQATDTARLMLNKLRCLIANPHPPLRTEHVPLLRVIADIACEDLEEASLFFMQFELSNVQALWPEAKQTHFLYQLEVADRRLRMGYLQTEADLPDVNEIYPMQREQVNEQQQHQFYIHACHLSIYLVFGDYDKAGQIAAQFINQILAEQGTRPSEQNFERELAASYYLLAITNLRQGDFVAACEGLQLSLDMYQLYRSNTGASHPFPWASIHRNLHLLDLLCSSNRLSPGQEKDWRARKTDLEAQWNQEMQRWRETLPVSCHSLSNSCAELRSLGTPMATNPSTTHLSHDEKPKFSFYPTFRGVKDSLSDIGVLGF